MSRSPNKRYDWRWKQWPLYAVFWIVGLVIRDRGVADFYRKGPWCAKCGRLWTDQGRPEKRLSCSGCGLSDPVAQDEFERAQCLPSGSTSSLLGLPLWALYFAVAARMLSAMPKRSASDPWWRHLGLQHRPDTAEEARVAYRLALSQAHPDHGGSREQMEKVRKAWESAERHYRRVS